MAAIPPGTLSFLYNVLNDPVMNANFRKDPHDVMGFFELTDDQRKLVEDIGLKLLKRRLEKEAALEVKQEAAREEKSQLPRVMEASALEKRAAASLKEVKLFKDTVSAAEVEKLAEEIDEYKAKMKRLILDAIVDELKDGYGHFW